MSQKMIWAQKYYERDISCSEMPKNDRMWFEKREKKDFLVTRWILKFWRMSKHFFWPDHGPMAVWPIAS